MGNYTTADIKEKLKDKPEELAKENEKLEISNDAYAIIDNLNALRISSLLGRK